MFTSCSPSTADAIAHLKRIKPYDGWSVEVKKTTSSSSSSPQSPLVRLLRRNVPITDTYYLDLHHDRSTTSTGSSSTSGGTVVGILTNPVRTTTTNNNNTSQAQVLVDSDGKIVASQVKIVSVTSWKPSMSWSSSSTAASATTGSTSTSTGGSQSNMYGNRNNRNNNSNTNDTSSSSFTEEQKQQMMLFFGYAVGAAILFRIFLTAFIGLYLLAVPILYVYMVQNCPPLHSFDPKKELKRVLRGYHLPENHPDKPKGFLLETIARVQATVATELATLPGYETTTIPLAGAAFLVSVRVPTAGMDFYWIGALNQWFYLYSSQIPNQQQQQQQQQHQ